MANQDGAQDWNKGVVQPYPNQSFPNQTFPPHGPHKEDDDTIDLDFLIAAVHRQWKVVASAMIIGLVLGLAYLMTATPLYTSSTRILYDQTQGRAVESLSEISGVFGDQSEFESQLELITSERIANKVVDALDLHLNDAFLAEGRSGLSAVLSTIKSVFNLTSWFSDVELSEAELDSRKRAAVDVLTDHVAVSRVNRTYIIQLSYLSESPSRAQAIAGTFAKAYLDDQLDSKYDATRRASEWLQTRIAELKEQSLTADLAVQRFKAENDLVNTGLSSGQNLAEAQLAGANAQLIVARGEVAERKAQYDKLNAAIESGDISIAVDASIDSKIITSMREKYLELSKQHAEFLAKLGEEHIKVINLRNEMREYQRLMFEELSRIRDSFKGEYDIAVEREKTLRENLSKMVSETASANKEQVRLRELEREAATLKSLLENFLQKYQEAIQQQSFPVNDARIIEEAKLPEGPSHPRKGLSLALALIMSGVVGSGIGALREFRERFFRTGDQVRETLGLEFLGLVPRVLPNTAWSATSSKSQDPHTVYHTGGMTNYVAKQPLSSFAEALRGAKVAADIRLETGNKGKIIGVISCLPGEGKSTISSNLAQLLAMQGAATLLIDGDMRNPGLTRAIARHAKIGLLDILIEKERYDQSLMQDPDLPLLRILPAVVKSRISHTADLLTSQQMKQVLAEAREKFEYTIIDLPPLAPVVDVKAFAHRVDGFVFVTEWGGVSRSLVKSIIDSNPEIKKKILGLILNKTNMDKFKFYQSYGSSEYYYSQYSNYYMEN